MTRILHTADWHLGARLIDGDRAEEHRLFLDWLLGQMATLKPNLLIIAGDVFDSGNPPQDALALYYRFLARVAAQAPCRVLVLGGNHDSPATLHAPRELLAALRIDVIGSAPADHTGALIELEHAVVCAVPFLRERDVRQAAPGQSFEEVAAAIREGIHRHYRSILNHAIPRAAGRLIVGTGHLTGVGVEASASERKIHVGNLGAVEASCFEGFAYAALGHIHRPQAVGSNDLVRYSGSPIPLSFVEADGPKEIRIIEIDGAVLSQKAIEVPPFRQLLRLSATAADFANVVASLQAHATSELEPWIELTLTDPQMPADFDRTIQSLETGLRVRVLKVVRPIQVTAEETHADPFAGQTLHDLQPTQVFEERLRRAQIDPVSDDGRELVGTFAELLSSMQETTGPEPKATA